MYSTNHIKRKEEIRVGNWNSVEKVRKWGTRGSFWVAEILSVHERISWCNMTVVLPKSIRAADLSPSRWQPAISKEEHMMDTFTTMSLSTRETNYKQGNVFFYNKQWTLIVQRKPDNHIPVAPVFLHYIFNPMYCNWEI